MTHASSSLGQSTTGQLPRVKRNANDKLVLTCLDIASSLKMAACAKVDTFNVVGGAHAASPRPTPPAPGGAADQRGQRAAPERGTGERMGEHGAAARTEACVSLSRGRMGRAASLERAAAAQAGPRLDRNRSEQAARAGVAGRPSRAARGGRGGTWFAGHGSRERGRGVAPLHAAHACRRRQWAAARPRPVAPYTRAGKGRA
jgi:hypothetical protein